MTLRSALNVQVSTRSPFILFTPVRRSHPAPGTSAVSYSQSREPSAVLNSCIPATFNAVSRLTGTESFGAHTSVAVAGAGARVGASDACATPGPWALCVHEAATRRNANKLTRL